MTHHVLDLKRLVRLCTACYAAWLVTPDARAATVLPADADIDIEASQPDSRMLPQCTCVLSLRARAIFETCYYSRLHLRRNPFNTLISQEA